MLFRSIATKANLRGQGLGSRITKFIVANAKAHGIKRVSLAVNAKNIVAAKLYEKIGFKSLGSFNTFETYSR